MANFPTILGSPLISGYGYQDQQIDQVVTVMESGIKRARQRTQKPPSDFTAEFLLDEIQLAVLDYFQQIILKSRTLTFTMDIKTGHGIIEHTLKFTSPPKYSRSGKRYKVSCNLETQERILN